MFLSQRCTISIILTSMAKGSEIKLLGAPASLYTSRVKFVLGLKSIEYEYLTEDLTCKSELLLKSNPIYKSVPVLIHGNNTPISESHVIIEYLDEMYPNTHQMLPSDPSDRAAHRFWAHYVDNKFYPLYHELRRAPEEGKQVVAKKMIGGAQLLEEVFVKVSKGKDYFGGDDIGYMDVVLGSLIGWTKFVQNNFKFNVFDEATTPRLVEWLKRMCSHEVIKVNIASEETHKALYEILLKYRS